MAESPTSLCAATRWGSVCSSHLSGLPASTNHLGDRFVLRVLADTTGRFAIDVEHAEQVITPSIARVLGNETMCHTEILFRWTELEVAAKLKGLPILNAIGILRIGGWAPLRGGIETSRYSLGSNLLSVGRIIN